MVNRYIQNEKYGKNFKVNFLNISTFNRLKEGDSFLKAAQYGLPTIMAFAASRGITPAELDTMNFLENEVLELKDVLIPLKSSSTLSAKDSESETGEAGRPKKDIGDLSDSREANEESEH